MLISVAFLLAGSVTQISYEASVKPDRIGRMYDEALIPSGEAVVIEGFVNGGVEVSPDGVFVPVESDSILLAGQRQSASGRVRVFAPFGDGVLAANYSDIRPGTSVRVSCKLKRDDEFRNPGGLSRRRVLAWQGLDATCSVKSPASISVLEPPTGFGFSAALYGVREGLAAKFRDTFSPAVAGVMIASLLGNKHFLDRRTADIFREGGTFHILVISGLHITFIGGLAVLFAGLFTRRRDVRFAVACSFLWLFTLAVGADVPVVRASLMFTILSLSHVIHRTGTLTNAFGTCALVLLVWRPDDLFSPSFQLTFVSVGAIVIAGFPLVSTLREIGEWVPTRGRPFPADVPGWLIRFCETLYWNEAAWRIESGRNVWSANLFKSPVRMLKGRRFLQRSAAYLFEGVLISAMVQAAMLPLVVHYFHRVTPVSILLNLWTGLLIGLESFASILAVLFSSVSDALALPFVYLAEFLHRVMVGFSGWFSDLDRLSFRVPVYAGREFGIYGVYILCVGFIAFAAFRWDPFVVPASHSIYDRARLKFAGIAAVVIGLLIVLHPFSSPRPDGRLRVEFLDVGQGDSIFVTFPNGETMLIDGGGRRSFGEDGEVFEADTPSIGEMVVSEFLWEKGYSSIDRIVSTHADADHIQGLSAVARNFGVGEAWLGHVNGDDRDEAQLLGELGRRKTPIRTVSGGDRFDIGGAVVEVLSPPPSQPVTSSENDRSVVLKITFGDREFLLTGDIERAIERDLVDAADLHADVVKVPHHGSKTSSTAQFVDAVRPLIAVIPVGRESPFGHPKPEVVERWRASGATVLTTGDEGTISFITDGADLLYSGLARNSEK